MPELFIRKTILVNKDRSAVFKILNNFHLWPNWSPWLILDPNATLKIDEDGKYYRWESPVLGKGEMRIISEEEAQSIHYDLQFFKPWKSKAKVSFFLNEKQESVEVVWTFKSKLPFYMFWMKKRMEVFLGMDYERGLLLLKDYAEHGELSFRLDFEGILPFEAISYFGMHNKTTHTEFKNQIATDFSKLFPYMDEHCKEIVSGPPFCIYHKFDVLKNRVKYTIGFPIKNIITFSNKNFHIGNLPQMKVHSIKIKGPYKYIENAWMAQTMHMQGKKIKASKKNPPFELYFNDPNTTKENELETQIAFPIR